MLSGRLCDKISSRNLKHSSAAFLLQARVVLRMRSDTSAPRVTLRQQPFALPEKVQATVADTYRNLKSRKLDVQRSMTLYLANRDTEHILFKPIKVGTCSLVYADLRFIIQLIEFVSSVGITSS